MHVHHLEGIHDSVVLIIQLMPGDAKFGEGKSGVGKGGVFVEVLEEQCEFGSVVQLLAGVQGDADKLGLLNFHFLKAGLEFVELMGVVHSHGCTKNTLDYSANMSCIWIWKSIGA